jgi:hypothetical protein
LPRCAKTAPARKSSSRSIAREGADMTSEGPRPGHPNAPTSSNTRYIAEPSTRPGSTTR